MTTSDIYLRDTIFCCTNSHKKLTSDTDSEPVSSKKKSYHSLVALIIYVDTFAFFLRQQFA